LRVVSATAPGRLAVQRSLHAFCCCFALLSGLISAFSPTPCKTDCLAFDFAIWFILLALLPVFCASSLPFDSEIFFDNACSTPALKDFSLLVLWIRWTMLPPVDIAKVPVFKPCPLASPKISSAGTVTINKPLLDAFPGRFGNKNTTNLLSSLALSGLVRVCNLQLLLWRLRSPSQPIRQTAEEFQDTSSMGKLRSFTPLHKISPVVPPFLQEPAPSAGVFLCWDPLCPSVT
jgi:hypothetical protein